MLYLGFKSVTKGPTGYIQEGTGSRDSELSFHTFGFTDFEELSARASILVVGIGDLGRYVCDTFHGKWASKPRDLVVTTTDSAHFFPLFAVWGGIVGGDWATTGKMEAVQNATHDGFHHDSPSTTGPRR